MAAVLDEYGSPLRLTQLAVPEPSPGAVIVRVVASTVCGTDVDIFHGKHGELSRLPIILGHENVGEVVAVNGRDRDINGHRLDIGDVVLWTYGRCGSCFWCR